MCAIAPPPHIKRLPPETRREQILMAALAEFAAHGIAGARVDRVAERAGCSAGLLYAYFNSKDALFDALFELIVARTKEEIPLDVDDLPDQVARLYEGNRLFPEVFRIVMWHMLERGDERIDVAAEGNATRIAEIAEGQREGRITRDFSPEQLHVLMVGLGALWSTLPLETRDLVTDEELRRETVVEAMRRILGD
jgi:AcrR family transcriptional regulator